MSESDVDEMTLTLLLMTAPPFAERSTRATMLITANWRAARDPNVVAWSLFDPAHTPPSDEEQEMTVADDDKLLVTLTFLAGTVPLLVIVIVNDTVAPGAASSCEALTFTARSVSGSDSFAQQTSPSMSGPEVS